MTPEEVLHPFNARRLTPLLRALLRDSEGGTVAGRPEQLRAFAKRGITEWNEPGRLTPRGRDLAERFRNGRAGPRGSNYAYVVKTPESALGLLERAAEGLGVSRGDLGRLNGLGGKAHPSRWFRGEVMPRADTFFRLAHQLGYDVALLPRRDSVAITTESD